MAVRFWILFATCEGRRCGALRQAENRTAAFTTRMPKCLRGKNTNRYLQLADWERFARVFRVKIAAARRDRHCRRIFGPTKTTICTRDCDIRGLGTRIIPPMDGQLRLSAYRFHRLEIWKCQEVHRRRRCYRPFVFVRLVLVADLRASARTRLLSRANFGARLILSSLSVFSRSFLKSLESTRTPFSLHINYM